VAAAQQFGRFKSEAIVRALESGPERLELGGEVRRVTVLFADMRGFSAFAEQHAAAACKRARELGADLPEK
jgi:adenylate cyclase